MDDEDEKEKENEKERGRERERRDENESTAKPESEPELVWNEVAEIRDCSNEHLLHILDHYAFDDLNRDSLNGHRNDIIRCIKTSGLNVAQILEMNRKDFAKMIVAHCNNKKLNGPSTKLFKYIKGFDLRRLHLPPLDVL